MFFEHEVLLLLLVDREVTPVSEDRIPRESDPDPENGNWISILNSGVPVGVVGERHAATVLHRNPPNNPNNTTKSRIIKHPQKLHGSHGRHRIDR